MASYNRIILMGHLTRDPELTYIQGGTAIAKFGLAVNRKFAGKDGEKKEEVDFFDIEAWEKQAENCNEYLKKGSGVLIEGRLKQERWEDKESGKQRSRIKVVASVVQFLPKGEGKGQAQDEQGEWGNGKAPF